MSFMDLAGSVLGGIGSTILGSVSSSRAAARAYEYSRLLQEHQMQLTQSYNNWYLRNSPKLSRLGYEKAGYNPLLALPAQGQSPSFGASMAPTENDMATDFASGVNSANQIMSQIQQRKLTKAQVDNVNADTDVKKYGPMGARLKNLLELYLKHKNNPVITKAVESQIVGVGADNMSSAISSFKNNHPTTMTVLRKIKQGDFKGAKYAIDLRRQRLQSNSNSAISSKPNQRGYDKGYSFDYLPDIEDIIGKDLKNGKLKRR